MIRSRALRLTTRSRTIGKAAARHGSISMTSPVVNLRMWSWQVAVPSWGPWAWPLIIIPQEPQMPSRQSCSKATGSWPALMSRSLSRSSISRNDMSSLTPAMSYSTIWPAAPGPGWRQMRSFRSRVLTCSSAGEVDVVEGQRFLVEDRLGAGAGVLPGGAVGEAVVVPQRLPFLGLVLDPEVAAARLLPVQGVAADEDGEVEEVVDPARLLQRLVERVGRARHPQVAVELAPQGRDLGDGLLQALPGAGHAAVVPHDLAHLAVEVVDRARALGR